MSEGKYIDRAVAASLILELFDKQTCVPRSVINEEVAELHRSRGGRLSRNPDVTIGTGLDRLREEDKAYNEPPGFWHIDSAGVDKDSPKYKCYEQRVLKSR